MIIIVLESIGQSRIITSVALLLDLDISLFYKYTKPPRSVDIRVNMSFPSWYP